MYISEKNVAKPILPILHVTRGRTSSTSEAMADTAARTGAAGAPAGGGSVAASGSAEGGGKKGKGKAGGSKAAKQQQKTAEKRQAREQKRKSTAAEGGKGTQSSSGGGGGGGSSGGGGGGSGGGGASAGAEPSLTASQRAALMECLRDTSRVIEGNPCDLESYHCRAEVNLHLGRLSHAHCDCALALELSPGSNPKYRATFARVQKLLSGKPRAERAALVREAEAMKRHLREVLVRTRDERRQLAAGSSTAGSADAAAGSAAGGGGSTKAATACSKPSRYSQR